MQNLRIYKHIKNEFGRWQEKGMEYDELCQKFYELSQDEETLSKLKKILSNGNIGSYNVSSGMGCDYELMEIQRRISMANLLITNPDVFDVLIENNINVFHGTNVNALPSILKYGLLSRAELKRKRIRNTTGERWTRLDYEVSEISFTDILSVAFGYSNIPLKVPRHFYHHPTANNFNYNNQEDSKQSKMFPMIIGTSVDELEKVNLIDHYAGGGYDAFSHIFVEKSFPLEYIKCIIVPKDKVEYVKRLLDNEEVLVLGINEITINAFHYSLDNGRITFYEKNFEKFKQEREEVAEIFNDNDIEEVVQSRSFEKIKALMDKTKGMLKRDGRRTK